MASTGSWNKRHKIFPQGNAGTNEAPLPGGELSEPKSDFFNKMNQKTYRSSVINIGSVPLGGEYPVRIQSMTNTDTLDTRSSIAQCIRIIEAGADFVRLTAQGVREAENLARIKNGLLKAGYNTPLIADIHSILMQQK
jgi:hypothetical protein